MTDRCTKGLHPGTSDNKQLNRWVLLHDGSEYLLPVVAKEVLFEPVFNDDGTVDVATVVRDEALQKHLDAFLSLTTGYAGAGELRIDPMSGYSAFMGLLRHLIVKNYDMPQEEMKALLTVNKVQFGQLFNAIWQHVMGE